MHFWRHFLVKHKILPNLFISNWLWWIKRVPLAKSESGQKKLLYCFVNRILIKSHTFLWTDLPSTRNQWTGRRNRLLLKPLSRGISLSSEFVQTTESDIFLRQLRKCKYKIVVNNLLLTCILYCSFYIFNMSEYLDLRNCQPTFSIISDML